MNIIVIPDTKPRDNKVKYNTRNNRILIVTIALIIAIATFLTFRTIPFGSTTQSANNVTSLGDYNTPNNNILEISNSKAISLPSEILNLTNWYLTLPYGSPDIVKQPVLQTFSKDPNFYSDGTAVIFRAEVGGTTTSGSTYPRSELRETKNFKNVYWKCDLGTHVMQVEQKVTHIQPFKPRVVVAQVHMRSDDFFLVRIGKDRNYDTNYVVDIHRLGVRVGYLSKDFQMDTKYKLTITMVDNNVTVDFEQNGSFGKLEFTSVIGECYFKAGCYTQSNTQKGDVAGEYSEVHMYSVTVSHG